MKSPKEKDYTKQFDLSLWRQLFRFLAPHRRDVILLALSGVATAACDVAFPLVTRGVIDEARELGADARFGMWGLIWFGLSAALAICIWALIWLAGKLRSHLSHDIRRAGFDRLQELSFSFYDHRSVGWLMARMTSDCERLSNIFAWGILDLVWATTLISAIAVVMLVIEVKLALVVLAVIPVVLWVSTIFRKRILKTARKVRKTNSKITASYNEGIMGVKTSKVFVREGENLEDFRDLSLTMFDASVRNALHSALYMPVVLTLGSIATGLALVFGGFEVAALTISIGTLIAFLSWTRSFFEPIHNIAAWFAEMQMAQASAERILGLIDTVPEIADSEEVAGRVDPDHIEEIEFVKVGFAYRDGPAVLTDFDLKVRAGDTIALVGATGGGKTTIVNLLCRFYEPTAGEIRLDGIDYRKRGLHWLQSSLGIVLQEPHLFSGSVRDNIRYGKLDATDEEVIAAAELAGAHAFIEGMEDGYDTDVGEGGVRLSTGQKQLVSFARAILAKPRILVMDEATSSVDTETEMRIQQGLAKVLEGRTSFVIAHRLSTIRNADRILVIEDGRIAEQGTHRELLAKRGRYSELYRQQSMRESSRGAQAWTLQSQQEEA
jgi:ATP-binding cassette subfamily B protein